MSFEIELQTFNNTKSTLMATYPHHWVVLQGTAILGVYTDINAAYTAGFQTNQSFMIKNLGNDLIEYCYKPAQ